MQIRITLILFMAIFAMACQEKKEAEVKPEEGNNQATITYPETMDEAIAFLSDNSSKTWEASAFNLSSIGQQKCRLDDKITFNSDGTYSYSNGEQKCGGDVSIETGTYELRFAEKQLIFNNGSSSEEIAEIVSLSEVEILISGSWSVFQISATFNSN